MSSETRRATSFLVSVVGFLDMLKAGLKCAFGRARQVTHNPPENQGFQEFIALRFIPLFFEPVDTMNTLYPLDPVDEPTQMLQVTYVQYQITLKHAIIS